MFLHVIPQRVGNSEDRDHSSSGAAGAAMGGKRGTKTTAEGARAAGAERERGTATGRERGADVTGGK